MSQTHLSWIKALMSSSSGGRKSDILRFWKWRTATIKKKKKGSGAKSGD